VAKRALTRRRSRSGGHQPKLLHDRELIEG